MSGYTNATKSNLPMISDDILDEARTQKIGVGRVAGEESL